MSLFPQLFPPCIGGLGIYNPVVQDAQPVVVKPVKPSDPLERSSWRGGFAEGSMAGFGLPGYGRLSIQTYYRMSLYPMIVKVHARIAKPVISGIRTIEVEDQGAGDEMCAKVKSAAQHDLLPMLDKAIPGSMESLLYGNWASEVIWDRNDGRIAPVDVQSFLPGEVILHADKFRKFSGFEINGVFRDSRYCFLAVHEPHIDSILGRSCLDAAAVAYFRSIASADNADAIEKKASGIQFLFHVMQGVQVLDATGKEIDGMALMTQIMNAAVKGKSAIVPDMWFSKDAIEKKPELAKIPYFRAQEFDWGNNGPALEAHLARLIRLDNEIYAAFGVSERAVSEAQNGASKSDAESHGDAVLAISEQEHSRTCTQWDEQVTATWKRSNYGDAKFRVWTRPKRADPQQEFLQELALAMVSNTSPDPEASANVNRRKLWERLDVPLFTEEEAKANMVGIQKKKAADDAAKAKQLQAKANGNGRMADMGAGN